MESQIRLIQLLAVHIPLFPFHAIRHAMVILMQKASALYRRGIVKGRLAFKQLSNEAVPNGKFVYDIRWTLACNFVLCH